MHIKCKKTYLQVNPKIKKIKKCEMTIALIHYLILTTGRVKAANFSPMWKWEVFKKGNTINYN